MAVELELAPGTPEAEEVLPDVVEVGVDDAVEVAEVADELPSALAAFWQGNVNITTIHDHDFFAYLEYRKVGWRRIDGADHAGKAMAVKHCFEII